MSDRTAKRTVQAAYDALDTPASDIAAVQRICVAPGDYDGGASPVLAMVRGKPARICGTVGVPKYVTSTLTAPLSNVRCARLRSSGGAASLITMIGGTASKLMLGCGFDDLLFEFRASTTKVGIDANSGWYGEINRCYGFADKTSTPAAVDAQLFYIRDDATYGGGNVDASWWRIDDNAVINMALGTLGDTGGNNNQHQVTRNKGLGLAHTNTSALPFLSIISGHRILVQGNNIEAYNVGIKLDHCNQCQIIGDGGEFVDYFIDAYSTHGCFAAPMGIRFKSLGGQSIIVSGARLLRMDQFCKNNVFVLSPIEAASFTNGLYNPMDDPTNPSVEYNGVPGTWGPNTMVPATLPV